MTYRQAGETLPAFSMETDGKMPEKRSKNIYNFLKKRVDKQKALWYNLIRRRDGYQNNKPDPKETVKI